jgi:vancomycin permeability regulator SanA
MRYLVAIICAVIGAFLATVFISSPVATLVVASQRFSDPDQVADLHSAVFMAVNAVGLITGWAVGWLVGGRIIAGETPPA